MRGRILLVLLGVVTAGGLSAQGQASLHRYVVGNGDLQFFSKPSSLFTQVEHSFSKETAHKGDFSESIRVRVGNADPGVSNAVEYVYLTPRAPVTDELRASMWVRSKKPGVKLHAR